MLVNERRRTAKRTRGIEVGLVCVVLAVVAAIGLAALGRARKLATVEACKGDARGVRLSATSVSLHAGPPGDVGPSTRPNPLVAGDTAGNGATLRSWPRNDRFTLRWDGRAQRVAVYEAKTGRLVGLGVDSCGRL